MNLAHLMLFFLTDKYFTYEKCKLEPETARIETGAVSFFLSFFL
jgi:hypothetical protein